MMDISSWVGLVGALFGTGSLVYMIVDKKLSSDKDKADISSVSTDVYLKSLDGFKAQIEFLNKQLAEAEAKIEILKQKEQEVNNAE